MRSRLLIFSCVFPLFGGPPVHDPASPSDLALLYRQRISHLSEKGDPALAEMLTNASRFLLSIGERAEALELARKAAMIDDAKLGERHPRMAEHWEHLAALESDPRPMLERTIAVIERQPRPDLAKLSSLHRRLGDSLAARNQQDAALDHYRRAVAAAEKLGPADVRLAAALVDLGFAFESREQFARAEPLYRRALSIQERGLSPRHPEVGVTLNNLAGVVGATGRMAQAEPLLRRALSILENTLGPVHSRVAAVCSNLADLLAAQGKVSAARPLWARAVSVYEQLGDSQAAAEVRASAK